MLRARPLTCIASIVLLSATVHPGMAADPDPVMTDKDYKPIIGKERLKHYTQQTFLNAFFYEATLGSAVASQIRNAPPEWGQGVKGYSTRVGSEFGFYLAQASVHEGTAALLHLDPRYVRSGQKGFARRFGHAIKWSFVTYDEGRHIRPNLPLVAGAYGSGMIATLWYPSRYNPLSDGVRWGSQQLGYTVGFNVLKEFTPELKRLIRR